MGPLRWSRNILKGPLRFRREQGFTRDEVDKIIGVRDVI